VGRENHPAPLFSGLEWKLPCPSDAPESTDHPFKRACAHTLPVPLPGRYLDGPMASSPVPVVVTTVHHASSIKSNPSTLLE